MFASIFHTIVSIITGLSTGFWFLIFIGAMAFLALMPPAEPHAPKAAPQAPPPGPPANNDNEEKWRHMMAETDAKWRRMLVMMHLRHEREQLPPQQPIQINIVMPEGGVLPAGNENILIENNSADNSANNNNPNAPNTTTIIPKNQPRLSMSKFHIPRPRLNIPRPRVAAKTRFDG